MLTIDPHKRLSCNQLLASDFINYKFPNKEKKTNDKSNRVNTTQLWETVDRNKEESMEKDMEKEDEFKPKI